MRISMAQINTTLADFAGNSEKILAWARRAKDEQKADMVLFPELAVSGYPLQGLLEDGLFAELSVRAVRDLCRALPRDIAVGIGFVGENPYNQGKNLANVYGIILNGKLVFEQLKTLLPGGDIFNEGRYFEPARERKVFEFAGERIGFVISEDAWREIGSPGVSYSKDPVSELLEQSISILCVPSASPFVAGKFKVRKVLAEQIVLRGNIPLVYVNAVGANDEVILAGRSLVIAPVNSGADRAADCFTVSAGRAFEEDLLLWDSRAPRSPVTIPGTDAEPPKKDAGPLSPAELDMLEEALVLGIRDYMKKTGFGRLHLGLSGGLDSALVAYLAVRAAGAENVVCFNMPSRFSSQGSKDDSRELARNLGCRYETIPIEPLFESFLSALEGVFEKRPFDVAEENLQSRIRGVLWMAFSNKFNSMLLAAGNKSEIAMGYCTLYGDTSGALAPIGDIFKTEVFALCRRINERSRAAGAGAPIPGAIIDKPPSAELRHDQKDEDSLPPYETLDEILRLYLYERLGPGEIAEKGWDRALVNKIVKTVVRMEYKRRQLPPVLKVSPRAFAPGPRMPMARALYEL